MKSSIAHACVQPFTFYDGADKYNIEDIDCKELVDIHDTTSLIESSGCAHSNYCGDHQSPINRRTEDSNEGNLKVLKQCTYHPGPAYIKQSPKLNVNVACVCLKVNSNSQRSQTHNLSVSIAYAVPCAGYRSRLTGPIHGWNRSHLTCIGLPGLCLLEERKHTLQSIII